MRVFAAGASASASISATSTPTQRCASWSETATRRFEALGAHVEDVGPLMKPLLLLQELVRPLWIGSFAVRLRQIPTQLHGKLDPGFRAAAEKGLSITLADYARAYEAKSKLARDLRPLARRSTTSCSLPVTPTAPPPVETLVGLRWLPTIDAGRACTLPEPGRATRPLAECSLVRHRFAPSPAC